MGRRRSGQVAYVRGRWVARVLLHREPPNTAGHLVYREEPVIKDGKEVTSKSAAATSYARTFAARRQLRYDDGLWTPPKKGAAPEVPKVVTVLSWVTSWLEAQTYREAERDRARVTAWLARLDFAKIPLAAVTPRDAAAALDGLRRLPTERLRPPAERTVAAVWGPIARALRAAVFEGHLQADPCAVLPTGTLPRSVDSDPTVRQGYRLRRVDVEALLGAPTPERWRVLWTLLALTGARLGEALALRWRDIIEDQPLRRIVIARSLDARTGIVAGTKTGTARTVPEHPELQRVLDAWHAHGWRETFGHDPTPDDLVVPPRSTSKKGPGERPGRLREVSVRFALRRDLERVGVPMHRVHDLRHTFATLCADAGMAENVAARWTHAPSGPTARHLYALPSWERQCAEMLLLRLTPRPPATPATAVSA